MIISQSEIRKFIESDFSLFQLSSSKRFPAPSGEPATTIVTSESHDGSAALASLVAQTKPESVLTLPVEEFMSIVDGAFAHDEATEPPGCLVSELCTRTYADVYRMS